MKPAIHAWCNKFTNSQESVIKERSGRSVVLMAARSFFIDNTFLTMSTLLDNDNDNDNDVYFTLATSDSRIDKYKTENN